MPGANEFDVGSTNGSGVVAFYGAAEVQATRLELAHRLPRHLIPVADAEGGNYVCLGASTEYSEVFFWDHETEEETRITNTFTDFLRLLRPFDPNSVELKPSQVVAAWIDPALLEEEKK